ncbi:Uncharacterised protein [Legionella hackeliae]|nr:Uncharacterised protein [Legionella hackeliae]
MHALVDCFKGIRNLGTELFHIPNDIFNDWNSSKSLKDVDAVIKDAEDKIASIIKEEERRLKQLLKDFPEPDSESKVVSELAKTDYHLTAGEQNDILTAMVRGLDGFATVFTHNIYGQDPVAGLIFTTAYAAGAAAIVCPSLASSLFGASYVNWFSNFSYSMGAGKFAAVLAGGSTQAQVFASGWDTVVHGPDSLGANVAVQVAEDPLTYASYFALAYTLGYVLVNGIHGHRIPGLSDILREDLGSTPEASYPFIGGKFAIGSYELFHHNPTENFHPVKINFNGTEHGNSKNLGESQQKTIKRLQMATWLSLHAETLPKLEADLLFMLGRHIDQLFTVEEASSLKKILYPEQEPSIAFQLFSIPLTYIPAVLRFAFAFFLSPLAWVLGNPSPLEPIKNAGRDLYSKITTDLNRILVAGSQFLHVCFKVISSPIKALIFTINMIVDRIAVLMDVPLAHSMHRTFAKTHTFFNDLGEWLYPVRATKSVIFANPAHTIKELEHSYISMLEELNASKKESEEKLKVTEIPHFSSPFASAIDGPFCADTNVLTTSM